MIDIVTVVSLYVDVVIDIVVLAMHSIINN